MLRGFTEGWNTKVKNEEYDTQGEDVGLHTAVTLPLHLTVVAHLIRLLICVKCVRSLIQAVDFRSFIAVGPYSLK